MKSWLTVAVVCASIVIVSACSGGDSAPSATTAPTAAISSEAAQATATNSLLAISDYPAGWTQEPSDLNAPKLGMTGDCAVLEEDGLPGDLAHAVSDSFIGTAKQDVSTGSAIFPDGTSAEAAYLANASLWSSCLEEFKAAWQKGLIDGAVADGVSPSDIQNVNVTISQMSAPPLGDSAMTLRFLTTLTVKGQPVKIVIDMFILREGNVLGYVSYFKPGEPDAIEENQLTQALDAKLRAGSLALVVH